MNLKLACADFTFPLLPHDRVLDLIAGLEMDGIDIGLFEGRSHLWPSREFRDVGKSARQLRSKLKTRGLKAADVFLQMAADFIPYAINHPEGRRRRKARDWFLRTLDYAAELGSPHVTTLPGVRFDDESKADSLGRRAKNSPGALTRLGSAQIVFAVEAHTGSIVPTPGEAAKLVSGVPGLTLTLDYTHFTRLGMPDSVVEPLTALATHFHVRGACKGRLQASFKDNIIDYARVLKALTKAGYGGHLGIEYVWIDWEHCNEVDNLSETILYRDFFRRLSRRTSAGIMEALGLIEITGLAPALVALDALEKASGVRVLQMELNDRLGALLKVAGPAASVRAAVDSAVNLARAMHVEVVADIINGPDAQTRRTVESGLEFNEMLQSDVVFIPNARSEPTNRSVTKEKQNVSENQRFALGLIETQGLTAVLEALDTAVKAANVEVVGREKLGGGYVTIIIRGDVAAVQAAVDAGKAKVQGLGKLIAAHVIPRPSDALLSILPRS